MYEVVLEYTADDEEPNCMLCDHVTSKYGCNNSCGANHCWCGYRRSETLFYDDDEIEDIRKMLDKSRGIN